MAAPDPAASEEPLSSIELIMRASRGEPPRIAPMPPVTERLALPMRDGVALDTFVWLPPDRPGPFPTILIRTPYQEHVMGWARLGTMRYRDAGYAVVFQVIRGVGRSGGSFSFNGPHDGADGFDTIAWIAAQPWSDGGVGMDGSSYAGMTQLTAAVTQPPALRCIVPAVVSADFFLHVPRYGGAFARQHGLGWTQLISVEGLGELTPGLWGAAALLASPRSWKRLLSRPARAAADGVLTGDRLRHYNDVLDHPTFDAFWAERTLGPDDYARIAVPTMVVTGLFDGTMGSQHIWANLERHAPAGVERRLLIGPWDHGQAYVGGGRAYGPWDFGEAGDFDLPGARLAFFDRHLKGEGAGPDLPGRATLFVNRANRWIGADAYPLPQVETTPLYLHSDGLANLRGRGRLSWDPPTGGEPPDAFRSDPELPFMPVAATLDPALLLDLRETERLEDVLTYTTEPFAAPLTLCGEFVFDLHVAADAPDCDVVCWLAEVPPDGRTTAISRGLLRLRYREGFDAERPLTPGEPVRVAIPMDYVAHEVAAGSRLRLLIGADLFPLLDPNPNTGEPVGDAVTVRTAVETVFHDIARPSCLRLPVLRGGGTLLS